MTEMVIAGPEVPDFSRPKIEPQFRIDEDVFTVMPVLPAYDLLEFAELADKQGSDDVDPRVLFDRMFRLVLTDDSATRFLARLADRANPIGIDQINNILPWIFEQVGMRPTAPSSSSSDGSSDPVSGLNLTANALAVVPNSDGYPHIGSSTTSTGS